MNPLVLLIAGIAFLAAMAGLYVKVHGDGIDQGRAEIRNEWRAANEKAERQARAKEADDRKRKELADAEHEKTVADLNAAIGKLRAESDRRRADFLPRTAPAAASADTACFDRPQLIGAYGSLVEGLRGLADEGSKAVVDLDAAKRWAKP